MMRTAVIVFLLASFALADGPAPVPDRPVTGTCEVRDGVRVLTLWGTPRERGYAQGRLLAREILAGTESGFRMVLAGSPALLDSRLRPLMAMGFRFDAAEVAELQGILEGIASRVPPEERKLACTGRELDLTDLMVLNTFGDWYALGCSSAALWGNAAPGGGPVAIRNFDFPALEILVGMQHVRVVAPGAEGEIGWVGISHPGGVGAMTALSAEGVFASIHDVPVLPEIGDYAQGNVPRLLAIKRIVAGLPAAGAVEKAAVACRAWNTLFGNNFLVVTPEPGEGLPAGVLEYDTREGREHGVTLRGPGEGEDFVVCSNHHRARAHGRCPRYDRLVAGCAAPREEPFDVPALFRLADRAAVPAAGVRISDSHFGTLHQVVALCGSRTLWVRLVAPDGNIRDAEPVAFDLPALLEAVGAGGPAK